MASLPARKPVKHRGLYLLSSPLPFFLAVDFLAKYCIFSQEKLAEYKRAFEAVSERGFKPSLFTLCLRYTPSFFLVFCLSLSLDLTLSLSPFHSRDSNFAYMKMLLLVMIMLMMIPSG